MKSDFLIALTQLAAERHLPKEQVLGAIEVALASAFKKDTSSTGQNISVKLNPNTGDVSVFALKTVVDDVEDPDREIGVLDAQKIRAARRRGRRSGAAGAATPQCQPHRRSDGQAGGVAAAAGKPSGNSSTKSLSKHKEDIISGVIEHLEYGRTMSLGLGTGPCGHAAGGAGSHRTVQEGPATQGLRVGCAVHPQGAGNPGFSKSQGHAQAPF